MPAYLVRNMDWDDLPRLVGIDKQSQYPWNYDDLTKAMESNFALTSVILSDQQVVGFAVYVLENVTPKKERKDSTIRLKLGLVKLTITPARRRKKAGSFLIQNIISTVIERFSRNYATGKVRSVAMLPETWLGPQLFLRSMGFKVPKDGIKKKVFDFTDDDGYSFERLDVWPVALPAAVNQVSKPAA